MNGQPTPMQQPQQQQQQQWTPYTGNPMYNAPQPTAFQGQLQQNPPQIFARRQFAPRPPPGRFFAKDVADFRIGTMDDLNPVTADEEAAFLHLAFTEAAMHDCFFENARRGKLTPMFVRSSGDRSVDAERAKVLSELIGLGMPQVAWNQLVEKIKEVKKSYKMKTLDSYSDDLATVVAKKTSVSPKTLQFDISEQGTASPGPSASQTGNDGHQMSAVLDAMAKMMNTQSETMREMQKLRTRAQTPEGRGRPQSRNREDDPGSGNPADRKRRVRSKERDVVEGATGGEKYDPRPTPPEEDA